MMIDEAQWNYTCYVIFLSYVLEAYMYVGIWLIEEIRISYVKLIW